MELENIQNKIRMIDAELEELKSQKRRLENELAEAEGALATAKKVSKEFDSFVSRKRSAKDRPTKKSILKSFTSFINKASAMLTGNDYSQAKGKVEELTNVVKAKIKRYTEDLNYCKTEIKNLQRQKEMLMYEYNTLLKQQNEGEGT